MRRQFLLASVGTIALTGSAFAADLPISPPPPVPIFTWTGAYIGGQIGYAWDSGNLNYSGFDPRTGLAFTTGLGGSPNGVIGGAHVGYSYQIDQWVFGLEGSVDGTSITNTVTGAFPAFGGSAITASTNSDIQGSNWRPLRYRLGSRFDLCHRWCRLRWFQQQLRVRQETRAAFMPLTAAIPSTPRTASRTTASAGRSAAASTMPSPTIGRYSPNTAIPIWGTVGNQGLAAAGFQTVPNLTNAFINSNHTINQNQVQVGFSYKFDMYVPAPVIAKY